MTRLKDELKEVVMPLMLMSPIEKIMWRLEKEWREKETEERVCARCKKTQSMFEFKRKVRCTLGMGKELVTCYDCRMVDWRKRAEKRQEKTKNQVVPQHNIVFVSGYTAPTDFDCVLSIPCKLTGVGTGIKRTEKLYVVEL
jgi:hypothetical protein